MASANPPANGNGNGGAPMGTDAGGLLFGSCCDALADILNNQEFNPLLAVEEESGVLFMAVGNAIIESEDGSADDADDEGEMAWFDQAVMFCPFCGTQVQTPESIEEKLGDIEEVG